MKPLLHFVLVIVSSFVVVIGAYDDQVCRVERRDGVGLAEYREGAMNLRTDYDTTSVEDCIQRCCVYSDDAQNHCNAVSYYYVDGTYGVCQLLGCFPLSSCVWEMAANFVAALVLHEDITAKDYDVNNQSAAWNQSTVTSRESNVSGLTTLPSSEANSSTPAGSLLDLQAWNVVNGEVPSQDTVPSPESPAVQGGTTSNNGTSNGTLSEGQGTALSAGTAQGDWNVLGGGLDLGNTNATSGNVTGGEILTEDRMIPDVDNDWNVVDTGILPDNEQPTLDNGQQQQQLPPPATNPFDAGPKDDWNDGDQGDDEDDFWSIFGAENDRFWSDEDDNSQSNETVAGAEADQNRNNLEKPLNQPEQPFNQLEQPPNQPEQPPNQPEQPPNQPEQPPNQPEQPFNQLEQPFNQPEQPPNQPEQPFNQPEQPPNQPEQPPNQPEQPPNQPEPSLNQPEEPQQSFDDVSVTEDNRDDWQLVNDETPPHHEDDTDGEEEEPAFRRILMPSPGLIIGLCAALGVAFLVLVAVCRKVYHGKEWPKYKPLRSDYDTRYEPSSSSSALLP